MKASEAKKLAIDNKNKFEQNVKTKRSKVFNDNVQHLHSHFMLKVSESIAKGHLATGPIQFSVDQFDDDVLRAVKSLLDDDGFSLEVEKHNAYKTVKFVVSWS
jgi:O-acetyl-ADP-ribose deacetylase (regulator of RNase III)